MPKRHTKKELNTHYEDQGDLHNAYHLYLTLVKKNIRIPEEELLNDEFLTMIYFTADSDRRNNHIKTLDDFKIFLRHNGALLLEHG